MAVEVKLVKTCHGYESYLLVHGVLMRVEDSLDLRLIKSTRRVAIVGCASLREERDSNEISEGAGVGVQRD